MNKILPVDHYRSTGRIIFGTIFRLEIEYIKTCWRNGRSSLVADEYSHLPVFVVIDTPGSWDDD